VSEDLRDLLFRLGGGTSGHGRVNLGREEMRRVFTRILQGGGTGTQVAALFALLRARGPVADELAGTADAARARLRFPKLPEGAVVVATSRLGKHRSPPLALAAAAAAAACEVPVLIQAAPHARGAGLTLGDLWQELVGPLPGDPEVVEGGLEEHGLACWRPTASDPGWSRLLRIEEETGLRSLPDVVTKLLAPPRCRLAVAASHGPVLGLAADALAFLGHHRAVVVQGVEGSLDPSVVGRTRGLVLEDGGTFPLRLLPEDFGLLWDEEPVFQGPGRLQAACRATLEVLLGTPGPALACALLGAAVLVRLSDRTRDLAEAVGLAREALESGAAQRRLEALRGGRGGPDVTTR